MLLDIQIFKAIVMKFSKKLNLIIYRFREKGLEVFLINDDNENWDLPNGDKESANYSNQTDQSEFIELDPFVQESGESEEALAIEGDWHDIPSLKEMIYEDALFVKDKMKNGAFVKVKEALKKALPHQYAFLKELKDILIDRNSVKDL